MVADTTGCCCVVAVGVVTAAVSPIHGTRNGCWTFIFGKMGVASGRPKKKLAADAVGWAPADGNDPQRLKLVVDGAIFTTPVGFLASEGLPSPSEL